MSVYDSSSNKNPHQPSLKLPAQPHGSVCASSTQPQCVSSQQMSLYHVPTYGNALIHGPPLDNFSGMTIASCRFSI